MADGWFEELTSDVWDGRHERAPFSFGHRLHQNPLMSLESLAQLAERLDPGQIEVTEARSPTVVSARVTERLSGLGAGEVVRRIETEHRWVSMRNVEVDASYRNLVDALFDEFRSRVGAAASSVYRPEGYVFIGAAGAVTPAHVDHEHNLFFQITGTKRFTTGRFPDFDSEQRTLEAMYNDSYGSTPYPPTDPETRVLGPGDGLYVPPTALHVVENADRLAISFSVVFHDRTLDTAALVHTFNSHLRPLRIDPLPPGRSAWRDRSKSLAVTAWRRAKRAGTRAT